MSTSPHENDHVPSRFRAPVRASGRGAAHDQAWRWSFAACCVLLISPLWATDLLPLVDAPQHAAQLAIAVRWRDEGFRYSDYFYINWVANTVTPYALGYVLALAFSVGVAVKLVLSLALLGLPLSTLQLLRTLNGDRWWVFATFPTAFGFGMMWGFMPFVLAAPVGLCLIDRSIAYRNNPSLRQAVMIAALAHLLFTCHVLVLAFAGLTGVLITSHSPTWQSRLTGSVALASVLPLVVAWWITTLTLTPGSTPPLPTIGDYGLQRIPLLFAFAIGMPTATNTDVLQGALLLSLPFLIGAKLTTTGWRYAPLVVTLGLHFALPMTVFNTALVYPRFTLFLVPSLLIALEPAPRRMALARSAAVALAISSLVLTAGRFHAFKRESSSVAGLLRALEPNKRLLTLVDSSTSDTVGWFPYLHFGCWYQVEKGGIADPSFAELYPNRFLYRPGMDPPLPAVVSPATFHWLTHGGELYDYFLVRDGGPRIFQGATTDLALVAKSGRWAVYRQIR